MVKFLGWSQNCMTFCQLIMLNGFPWPFSFPGFPISLGSPFSLLQRCEVSGPHNEFQMGTHGIFPKWIWSWVIMFTSIHNASNVETCLTTDFVFLAGLPKVGILKVKGVVSVCSDHRQRASRAGRSLLQCYRVACGRTPSAEQRECGNVDGTPGHSLCSYTWVVWKERMLIYVFIIWLWQRLHFRYITMTFSTFRHNENFPFAGPCLPPPLRMWTFKTKYTTISSP